MHAVVGTLRFKLAALNLLVFGIILSLLGVTALAIREDYLRQDFDERLVDRAEAILDGLRLSEERAHPAPERRGADPLRFPGYFWQTRAADGTVLQKSATLGDAALPPSAGVGGPGVTTDPVLETCRGPTAAALLGPGAELRMLTWHRSDETEPALCLQVASSLGRINASVADLRRLFLLLLPGGLLAVGLASWFLAGRSLTPIRRIAREARHYTAAHLDRRIDVPPGHDEVAEMAITLNRMLDRLEAAFRAQERFVADASHEFRTPIAVMLAEGRLLSQRAPAAEDYDRFLGSVMDELRRLADLIDSLLILARADAGFALEPAALVPIHDVVTDAVQRCEPHARQREVRLVPRLALPPADRPDVTVRGDAGLLRAMCDNLLRNAVRHSPPGEVAEVEVALTSSEATIAVRDRGPGLPPEDLHRVFERFYRVAREGQPVSGTGLGLAIARAVAQLHHGAIRAANREGGGCEFTVRLPLAPSTPAEPD